MLAAILALAPSTAIVAQPATPPSEVPSLGSRVRVWTSSSTSPLMGRLASFGNDSLSVRNDLATHHRLHLRDITRLEVYRRGGTAATAGILAGAAGAVAGGVVYRDWCENNSAACHENQRRSDSTDVSHYDHSVPVASVLIVGGAIAGAAIGYFLAPSQWQPVATPIRLSVVPNRRGIIVAGSVAFGGGRLPTR
jgi:hypothetical protein